MPTHTGRVGDRPKSILEDAPEGDMTLADGVVELVGVVGVLRTQLDQFPHQLVSFVHRQLIPGGHTRMYTIITVIVDFRLDPLGGVVGDGDAQISLIHVLYFLSVPLLEHLKYITNMGIRQAIFLDVRHLIYKMKLKNCG